MNSSRASARLPKPPISLCRANGFTGDHWGLPTMEIDDVTRWLFCWHNAPMAIDAGMPGRIAECFSVALTKVARLTYLHDEARLLPEEWQPLAQDACMSFRLGGLLSRRFGFRSTKQSDSVLAAFYDEQYPWQGRAQAFLLSPPQFGPPQLKGAPLEEILFRHYLPDRPAIRRFGIHGVLLPGVDGDVAGLYLWDTGLVDALEKALAESAAALDLPYKTVAEADLDNPSGDLP